LLFKLFNRKDLGATAYNKQEAEIMSKEKPTSEKLAKKDVAVAVSGTEPLDETVLFERVAAIIESRKARAGAYANREVTMMYWEVGHYINSVVLDFKRAEYGKQIFSTLSRKLIPNYGRSFERENLYRMTQFAKLFPDLDTVSGLSQVLSWSHFSELIRLKADEARLFYANDAATRHLGVRELRRQISRKAFERGEIFNIEQTAESIIPFNVFKDPYLLDALGLKDNYLEADLEEAILIGLEAFILEFGHGLAFVERQKRMTMDGDDFKLDLLFYHRVLQRLVAIDLKIGSFKPEYMGQMRFYLKWLNRFERQTGEQTPIGIILCTGASRDQIELLELDKEGIAVAEYWTELPPKAEFERKIKEILYEARERLSRRRSLPPGEVQKRIDYFLETKDDEGE
jgi:predicted nuclease of restriction endonuclease-like (RecB) superfamily